MAGLTAEQIIERIANANGVAPTIVRQQIEQALRVILADATHPHCLMLADLFPGGQPDVEELVVTLEYALYNTMMPKFPGWEWDGEGYRNTGIRKKKQQSMQ